jgi:hypothetical protein
MSKPSRNGPCFCGSGRNFKHCCKPFGTTVETVADDIPEWVLETHGDEMRGKFQELWDYERDGPPPQALLAEEEGWVLLDRPLADGPTPARLYAERADLPSEGHRRIARLIADAHQRLLRVTAVQPGILFSATDLGSGEAIDFVSPKTSRELKPGFTILARAVLTSPPMLFGTVISVHGSWTEQLLAELQRDRASATRNILRSAPILLRPAVYTPERAPMRSCEAIWTINDRDAVLTALDDEPRLTIIGRPHDGRACIVVQARRTDTELRELAADRSIPEDALTIDSIIAEIPHLHGFGIFKVYEDELRFEAMSEVRLQAALAEVANRIPDAELVSVNSGWEVSGGKPTPPRPQPSPEQLEEFAAFHSQVGGRKWIETPLPVLEGLTPRQASGAERLRPTLSAIYQESC